MRDCKIRGKREEGRGKKEQKFKKNKNGFYLFFFLYFFSSFFLLPSSFFYSQGAYAADSGKKEEDAFYVAVKAYEDGFYDASLTLFDRFLNSYVATDKRVEALIYMGQCYFSQEKYVKALDQFENLLKTREAERFKDKILFWLGEIYLRGRDYRQASSFYEELIKNYGSSFYLLSAYRSLALAQGGDGRWKEALATYRQMVSRFSDPEVNEEALFGACDSLYQLRDFEGLKKEIQIFIARYPRSEMLGRIYFYWGEACFYLGEYQEAVEVYQKAAGLLKLSEQKTQAYLGEGWSYLKLKKFREAEGVFSKFEDEGQPLAVLLGKAVLATGLEDFTRSLELYEKVIEQDKDGEYAPVAYFGKAEVLYSLSRFDESIVAYRISLDRLKSSAGPYMEVRELRDKICYGLAWAYLKIGDFSAAQEQFQKVAATSTDRIFKLSALCQLGDTYQDAGDYKSAIETYQSFLSENPETVYNDYIQYQLGMTWLKMKDLDSAILAFRKLLHDYSQSKLNDDANYFLGLAYFQKGDFSAALQQLKIFEKDFRDSPLRAQALFLLGETLLNTQEFKPAIDVFQIIIKEYARQEVLRQKAEYEVANSYAQMGNEPEANKRLADFIMRYPDSQMSADILYWLGQTYSVKKDHASARKYFEKLIRNYPVHEYAGDALLELGLGYQDEGDEEAALRNFQLAKTLKRGDSLQKASLCIGDVYRKRFDWEQALKNYREAASFEGELSKTAYKRIGEVLKENKSYSEAVAGLEKALSLEGPEANAEIQFILAESLEEAGSPDAALEAYLKVYYLYSQDGLWPVKSLLRVARIYEDKEEWRDLKSILEKISGYQVPEAKYAVEKLAWLKESGFVK